MVVRQPKRDWLATAAPDLQIVDDTLWNAVQERLRVNTETYLRDGRGKLWSKPDLRRGGKYLVTGLARCGTCGRSLTVLGGRRRV